MQRGYSHQDREQLNIRIDAEKITALKLQSERLEITLSDLVRSIMDEWLLKNICRIQTKPDKRKNIMATRSRNIKNILYQKQNGECVTCEKTFPIRNLVVDHIVPVSKGGPDIDANKQLLCPACNTMKSNRLTTIELKKKLIKEGVVKPQKKFEDSVYLRF